MPTLMKKGNGERLVHDEKVTEYLEMGYSVISSDGEVLQKPEPTNVAQFRIVLAEKDAEIAALKERITQLEAGSHTAGADENESEEDPSTEPTANEADNTRTPSPATSTTKPSSGGKTAHKAKTKA